MNTLETIFCILLLILLSPLILAAGIFWVLVMVILALVGLAILIMVSPLIILALIFGDKKKE
jgi:hypothetical protein